MSKPLSEAFYRRYQAPEATIWSGRKGTTNSSPQYLHEFMMRCDLTNMDLPPGLDCALLGYACDVGVLRNQGRVGAVQGPHVIRQAMAKMAWHRPFLNVSDLGNLICEDSDLESTQGALAELVCSLVDKQVFPLILGGGHDISYGHAKGLMASKKLDGKKLGIINLDAHFDLRSPSPLPHSGSPFAQLLDEYPGQLEYLVLGIQKPANPAELFHKAEKKGVVYVEIGPSLEEFKIRSKQALTGFLRGVDQLYLTIDLDGFSSAYAPGVSAPSPMGFDPFFALEVIDLLHESGKLMSMDLAECNPLYDQDMKTALLAARLAEKALRV